jgi:hypothetical protein
MLCRYDPARSAIISMALFMEHASQDDPASTVAPAWAKGMLSSPGDGGDHAAVRRRLPQRFAKSPGILEQRDEGGGVSRDSSQHVRHFVERRLLDRKLRQRCRLPCALK